MKTLQYICVLFLLAVPIFGLYNTEFLQHYGDPLAQPSRELKRDNAKRTFLGNPRPVRRVYDYIVCGAGAAGSIVATRLAQAGYDVLIADTGEDQSDNPLTQPNLLVTTNTFYSNLHNHVFSQEGPSALGTNGNGRLYAPICRNSLGGCAAINGMSWQRGDSNQWDIKWTNAGLRNWTYADVLPFYKKTETWLLSNPSNERGTDGPIIVQNFPKNQFTELLINATAQVLNLPIVEDNSVQGQWLAASTLQRNIAGTSPLGGERQSSWIKYLMPELDAGTSDLELVTRATIVKVLTRKVGNNINTFGVEMLIDGERYTVRARREVILSMGALVSPKTLLLSGIGNAAELAAIGIDSVLDLPGVGKNLKDHTTVGLIVFIGPPITNYDGNIAAGYYFSNITSEVTPDIEIASIVGTPFTDPSLFPFVPSFWGWSPFPLELDSAGEVRLINQDPLTDPSVQFGFLQSSNDFAKTRDAIRRTFEMVALVNATIPLQQINPTPFVLNPAMSDTELDAFITNHISPDWHYSSTCRMGLSTDPMSVVDDRFRVHGINDLRVIDSSAFAFLPGTHPMASIMMLGERGADFIINNTP